MDLHHSLRQVTEAALVQLRVILPPKILVRFYKHEDWTEESVVRIMPRVQRLPDLYGDLSGRFVTDGTGGVCVIVSRTGSSARTTCSST